MWLWIYVCYTFIANLYSVVSTYTEQFHYICRITKSPFCHTFTTLYYVVTFSVSTLMEAAISVRPCETHGIIIQPAWQLSVASVSPFHIVSKSRKETDNYTIFVMVLTNTMDLVDRSGLVLSEGPRAYYGPEKSEQQTIGMSRIKTQRFWVKIGLFKHFHWIGP